MPGPEDGKNGGSWALPDPPPQEPFLPPSSRSDSLPGNFSSSEHFYPPVLLMPVKSIAPLSREQAPILPSECYHCWGHPWTLSEVPRKVSAGCTTPLALFSWSFCVKGLFMVFAVKNRCSFSQRASNPLPTVCPSRARLLK